MQCVAWLSSLPKELCPAGWRNSLYTHMCEYTVSWRLIFQSLGLPFSKSAIQWSLIICLWLHKVHGQWIWNSWCKPHFSSAFSSLQKLSQGQYSLTLRGLEYLLTFVVSLSDKLSTFLWYVEEQTLEHKFGIMGETPFLFQSMEAPPLISKVLECLLINSFLCIWGP